MLLVPTCYTGAQVRVSVSVTCGPSEILAVCAAGEAFVLGSARGVEDLSVDAPRGAAPAVCAALRVPLRL